MTLGTEKCAFVHLKSGKIQTSENIELMDLSRFPSLPNNETYKYLGMQQALTIDQTPAKEQIRKAMCNRLKLVLNTELYALAKATAINAWVIPIVTYSFGVLRWSQTDLEQMDRLIRTSLTKKRLHHPKSSMSRLYLPRKSGGRGLKNLQESHAKEVGKLHSYLKTVTHPLHQAIVSLDHNITPMHLSANAAPISENKNFVMDLEQKWKEKELHGRYAAVLNSDVVDKQLSTMYLVKGQLLMETEGFVGAIQDQVMATRNYRKYILKQNLAHDRCRLCNNASETIQHLSSGCSYLAPRDHKNRHDDAAKILHQAICHKFGLVQDTVPYYKYSPKDVLENEEAKIYWDMAVITDREISHNRPDILIFTKKENTARIIDITIPADHNILEARNQKISKYLDLAHEIKAIYQLAEVTIHPFVISANGLIEKRTFNELERLSIEDRKEVIVAAQKAILLGTCRTVRRVLNHE